MYRTIAFIAACTAIALFVRWFVSPGWPQGISYMVAVAVLIATGWFDENKPQRKATEPSKEGE